jgi:hypothetical protein
MPFQSMLGWLPCTRRTLRRKDLESLRIQIESLDGGSHARVRNWLKEIPDVADQESIESVCDPHSDVEQPVSVISQATTSKQYCSSEGSEQEINTGCFNGIKIFQNRPKRSTTTHGGPKHGTVQSGNSALSKSSLAVNLCTV